MKKIEKHRLRLVGLLTEKVDDINDTLMDFPETDDYVKLKKEEKSALQYAIKLIDEKLKKTKNENYTSR